jgi:hypothetical protein
MLVVAAACAEGTPANMRTMKAKELETLVGTCTPCGQDCLNGYVNQCAEGKVTSETGTGGECLVYCVGQLSERSPTDAPQTVR